MIGAMGLSYEEAAKICGVAIGTIKSCVNRARVKLTELLGLEGPDRGRSAGKGASRAHPDRTDIDDRTYD